jgi:hypothetical protein
MRHEALNHGGLAAEAEALQSRRIVGDVHLIHSCAAFHWTFIVRSTRAVVASTRRVRIDAAMLQPRGLSRRQQAQHRASHSTHGSRRRERRE